MESRSITPVVASSLNKDNLWFVFRDDGKEVPFYFTGGKLCSRLYKLTENEINYINKNLRK
jgi:hypothetical protein